MAITDPSGEVFVFDFTNFKSQFGDRVPAGRYTVEVETVESVQAKSGTPGVRLWLRVLGGEYEGSTLMDTLYLSEAALWRAQSFLEACGIPTPKKEVRLKGSNLVGRRLTIDVADGDPYNGRVKTEVRGYMQVEGAAAERASQALDLEDLDSATSAPAATDVAVAETSDEVSDLVDIEALAL
jgi:hypothetical protein